MPQFDYDSLAACLDEHWPQDEAKARAKIRDFLWLVKGAFRKLGAVSPDNSNHAEYARWSGERAEATNRIRVLLRLMNDPDANPEALAERRRILITIGAEVSLPNLYIQQRRFAEDIGRIVLASRNPEEELRSLLYGPPATAEDPRMILKRELKLQRP
jgi:hypothetical protein